jgi:hypothetical protein
VNKLRIVNNLADRMLNMIAPKVTAEAACLGNSKTVYCKCQGGYIWVKSCTTVVCPGFVGTTCGSCYEDKSVTC